MRFSTILALLLAAATPAALFADDTAKPGEQTTTTEEKREDAKQAEKEKQDAPKIQSLDKDEFGKLLDEVSANMRKIEDLLNQRNTGEGTQQLQSETNKKIEELIRIAES